MISKRFAHPFRPLQFVLAALGIGSALADPVQNPVDQLNQTQMQEIFQLLRSTSLSPEQLSDEALNRAALQGLFQRLGHAAELIPKAPAGEPVPLLISELLSETIGYLRPGTFAIEELPKLDVALDTLQKSTVSHLILDLRSPAPEGDNIAAAQFLSRFVPDATPLFTLRKAGETKPRNIASKSKGGVRFSKPLVLLIDSDTCNVGETTAAVLRQKLNPSPFLIGTKTSGRAMDYRVQPFSETHQLRLAETEAVLDNNTKIYLSGLQPDLEVAMDLQTKRNQFTKSEKEGMKPYGFDVERPRLNEAALVSKTNPELAYQLAKSAGQISEFEKPAPKDVVLQQALDFLTAQTFYRQQTPSEVRKAEKK